MNCLLCGLEIPGKLAPRQVRHRECQLEHRRKDRNHVRNGELRAALQRIRRAPDSESPAVIEAQYQAALAEVKRTRPFTIEVGWQSALARLG